MNNRKVTLTLYPNAFGLSYVISKSPNDIINFGKKVVLIKQAKDFLDKIAGIMDDYEPELLILRDYDHPKSQLSKKYKDIWQAIEQQAKIKGFTLFKYSRDQIKEVFSSFDAKTKFEISERIIEWYPQLKSRSPRRRKPWMNEDNQMGIFDAFSLMLTPVSYTHLTLPTKA